MTGAVRRAGDTLNTGRGALAVVILAALVALALWPTTESLIARWVRMDEAYSHGFLLFAAVLALIWTQDWPIAQAGRRWPWVVAMVPLGILWLVGHVADIILFQQVTLPLFWLFGVGAVWATPAVRAYAFPILFLYFAIPVWDHLVPQLVEMAVQVVSFFVARTHIPVMIQGNQIEIPSGIITVADGCSGERYLVVGLAFGVLAAKLYFKRWPWRLLIIGLALALGLVTNWLRIYLLVLIGYATEMRSSLMHDHEAFGFVLFGVMFAFLVWLIRARSDLPEPPKERYTPGLESNWGGGLAWLVLLVLPPLTGLALHAMPVVEPAPLPERRGEVAAWPLPSELFNHRTEARQEGIWLVNGEPSVWLAVTRTGFGGAQDLFPYSTMLLRESWVVLGQTPIRDGQGRQGVELELVSVYAGERFLVRYYLAVGKVVTANPYLAKLAELPARLADRPLGTRLALMAHCPAQDCRVVHQTFNQLQAADPSLGISFYLDGGRK